VREDLDGCRQPVRDVGRERSTPLLANSEDELPPALFIGSVAVCATQPVGLVAIGVEGGLAGFF
jgi:hypothetical protein